MEKNITAPHESEKEAEAASEVTSKSTPSPILPKARPPLTPEEIEAGLEMCKMMGIDLSKITEAELNERQPWE